MPSNHDLARAIHERRPDLLPNFNPDDPDTAPDLEDPTVFNPLYLGALQHLAANAESDHDRLSALYLLAEQRGYAKVKGQLLKLSKTTRFHRVMLTAVYLIARALRMVEQLVPDRPNGGGLPNVPLPTPSLPRAPAVRLPPLPYPRLPLPRKRRPKRPRPKPAPEPTAPTSHPIPESLLTPPPPKPNYDNFRRRILRDLGRLPPEPQPTLLDLLQRPRDPPLHPAG